MATVIFEDHREDIEDEIRDVVIAWLYEASGEIQAQTIRNIDKDERVDTGQTKNSWTYKVDEDKLESTVGSPLQNAIWEEYGTGQYALAGNGRKTPWKYRDRHGDWHTTTGKNQQGHFIMPMRKIKLKSKKHWKIN